MLEAGNPLRFIIVHLADGALSAVRTNNDRTMQLEEARVDVAGLAEWMMLVLQSDVRVANLDLSYTYLGNVIQQDKNKAKLTVRLFQNVQRALDTLEREVQHRNATERAVYSRRKSTTRLCSQV